MATMLYKGVLTMAHVGVGLNGSHQRGGGSL